MKTIVPRLRKLKNGVRVAWMENPASTACAFEVFFTVGSRHESEDIMGASHFLEHLMFKGTKKRPNAQAVSQDLDRYGAEYNASTGKDHTSYYVKIEADRALHAMEVLHDMLANATLKPADIQRERGVIIEEINMYEDNPQSYMSMLLDKMSFGEHPLGREIAGTREVIREITPKRLRAHRDQYYAPERMVIAVAGRIPKEAWAFLESSFGSWKRASQSSEAREEVFEAKSMKGVRLSLVQKKIEQVQLGLSFSTFPMLDPRQDASRLLAVILGGTMSSRLFSEVREKRGLCYDISAGRSSYADTGVFRIVAGLEKGSLQAAIKVIWAELGKMSTKLVSAQELRRAKDYVRGKFYLGFEDPLTQADWYGDQLCYRETWRTPEERMKGLEAVTPAQIRAVAKELFDRKNYAVSVVGPYESAEEIRGWL